MTSHGPGVSDLPPYRRAFVLEPQPGAPVRETNLDIYLPAGNEPAAGVVFVPGGPVPIERRPTPRDWPVYRGYGSAAAERGLVGATLDHRFHDFDLIREAGEDIAEAVDRVRLHPRVDPDRIAVWFFSGGAVVMGTGSASRRGGCVALPPAIRSARPSRNWQAKLLHVRRVPIGGQLRAYGKTAHALRVVPLAERALEALEAHPARIDTTLLFSTRSGTPIDLHR